MYYNNKQCLMPLQNTKKDKRLVRQLNLDPPYKITLFDFSSTAIKHLKEQCNVIKQCAQSRVGKG